VELRLLLQTAGHWKVYSSVAFDLEMRKALYYLGFLIFQGEVSGLIMKCT
jgi:hypothetical protein